MGKLRSMTSASSAIGVTWHKSPETGVLPTPIPLQAAVLAATIAAKACRATCSRIIALS
jgi:hypothetical protein